MNNTVLTIAGSDSSGGAGIQADLKAFESVGIHGATVITCITAQNSKGVSAIEPLDSKIIESQLDSVLEDLRPMVIKTGMLYSSEIVKLLCQRLERYRGELPENKTVKLVVDPVLVSTSGSTLTRTSVHDDYIHFIETLKTDLFPIATIITPNLPEASELLGYPVNTLDDMKIACRDLMKLGSQYVLLKGGHRIQVDNIKFKDKAVDLLYSDNKGYKIYKAKYIDKIVHGTGCTFASAIAGYLAKEVDIETAVGLAKELVSSGIKNSLKTGEGIDSMNLQNKSNLNPEMLDIILEITNSKNELLALLVPSIIPEVGTNIGYSIPGAKDLKDICALTGRLIRVGDGVGCLGKAEFGASKHVGRIILAAMRFDEKTRSAMNIKYRVEMINICQQLRFKIGSFSRENEPEEVSSMEWGTQQAIELLGFVPDIIFDTGGLGKEPMIRILGTNPKNVIEKLKKVVKKLER
jgi:hydroxymethylpyrimidine/phosphomethylpyrimidine kinase